MKRSGGVDSSHTRVNHISVIGFIWLNPQHAVKHRPKRHENQSGSLKLEALKNRLIGVGITQSTISFVLSFLPARVREIYRN